MFIGMLLVGYCFYGWAQPEVITHATLSDPITYTMVEEQNGDRAGIRGYSKPTPTENVAEQLQRQKQIIEGLYDVIRKHRQDIEIMKAMLFKQKREIEAMKMSQHTVSPSMRVGVKKISSKKE